MEYINENIAGSLRAEKQKGKAIKKERIAGSIRMPQIGLGEATIANREMTGKKDEVQDKLQKIVQESGISAKLRNARNLDRKSFDSAKKVMPAPLKIGVTAAEMMGIDVFKVLKIVAIVSIVLQILFWVIIILAAGYVLLHPGELMWEFFKGIFGGIVDTVKDVVVPSASK